MIRDLNYVLNYMFEYVSNKDMQDSEPMLNHRDIELVLRYIKELNTRINKAIVYIDTNMEKQVDWGFEYNLDYKELLELKNILKGSDDDGNS